jgi:hypothetical protein
LRTAILVTSFKVWVKAHNKRVEHDVFSKRFLYQDLCIPADLFLAYDGHPEYHSGQTVTLSFAFQQQQLFITAMTPGRYGILGIIQAHCQANMLEE